MTNNEVMERYNALYDSCINNKHFIQLLDEIENEAVNQVSTSPELAVEAHYDLKAIKRLRDKLNNVVHDVAILKHKTNKENY